MLADAFEQVATSRKTPDCEGKAKATGDASVLTTLAGLRVEFDPLFEITPGTAAVSTMEVSANTLDAVAGATLAE